MSTEQRGVSLQKKLWTWIYAEFKRHGYPCHSHFMRDEMIMFAIKNNPKLASSDPQGVKEFEKYDEIRQIADRRRQEKFAIVGAVDDFEKDVAGLEKALEKGWITEEQFNEKVKESEQDHKRVVELQLSKQKQTIDKLQNKIDPTSEEELESNYSEEQERQLKQEALAELERVYALEDEIKENKTKERLRKKIEKNPFYELNNAGKDYVKETSKKLGISLLEAREILDGAGY